MYKSKHAIERKLRQINFVYSKRIKPRAGKIFELGGLDEETGCNIINLDIAHFITLCRSVFQYAISEIKDYEKQFKDKKRRKEYERYINKIPIIKTFTELRDHEVHTSPTVGHHVTVSIVSRLTEKAEKTIHHQTPDNTVYSLTKELEPNTALFRRLKGEGRTDLIQAMRNDEVLCETIECDGEDDLFVLCERYLDEINRFVEYGVKKGFIT